MNEQLATMIDAEKLISWLERREASLLNASRVEREHDNEWVAENLAGQAEATGLTISFIKNGWYLD